MKVFLRIGRIIEVKIRRSFSFNRIQTVVSIAIVGRFEFENKLIDFAINFII